MTTQGTQKLSSEDEKKEILALKARIAELENKQAVSLDEEAGQKIDSDSYIPIMSLTPYSLNLSTKEMGQGSIKKFTKFGEVKRILYRDLVDIMETNPTFLKAGFYYILDPRVIRFHGLDEIYTKILTKEKIDEILDFNSEEGLALYNSANEEQQKIIIGLIVDKLVDNPRSVNLNVVDSISRISGVKIYERVDSAKMMLENMAEK